jgi:hypothetical protein
MSALPNGNGTYGFDYQISESGSNYIAYLWAEVPGFSKFGSYTGNGSADGPFVYCGFKPRFIMIKRTDNVSDWLIKDTSRSTANSASAALFVNSGVGEYADQSIDILSNGFKLRTTGDSNKSSGTYVFAAFAEAPFKYANAR